MIDTNVYRERLLKRRAELDKRLHKLEDLLDDPQNPDVEDRATEREQDEVYESQGNAGLKEIDAIDAALDRIENGTFGVCVSCENPISEARLDAVPFATRCRNCME